MGGNLLIVSTGNGTIYVHDWQYNKTATVSFKEEPSINSVWFPSAAICCADVGLSSVYSFNPEEILKVSATQGLLSQNSFIQSDPNNNFEN